MTKDDLITNCTIRLGTIDRNKMNVAVNSILELMSQRLIEKERIEIRGFGSFNIKQMKEQKSRNPKSGEPVTVAAKAKVHFKPGKELKERVNHAS